MKAIRKKPGCEPELIDIDNTLKALQTEVGGYIETVSIADVVIICNEEGRLCGLPFNCWFFDMPFVGTILVDFKTGFQTVDIFCGKRLFRESGLARVDSRGWITSKECF